ncbi:hypothetical protein NPIL_238121 [Nephila pilipes]|uniref:Uncharacterized protein n=1 Tax=Nephila pilipes TaxID=299642 RepID=A0A8X6PV24_NEPPI|nr:hypothetical protein NPIL_238121 [Nephila pilipes]
MAREPLQLDLIHEASTLINSHSFAQSVKSGFHILGFTWGVWGEARVMRSQTKRPLERGMTDLIIVDTPRPRKTNSSEESEKERKLRADSRNSNAIWKRKYLFPQKIKERKGNKVWNPLNLILSPYKFWHLPFPLSEGLRDSHQF